jgi:hypothetical protein
VPRVYSNINSNLNIVQMFVCDKSHCSADVPVCAVLSIQGMQRMNMNGYTYSPSIYTKNVYVLVQSNLKYPLAHVSQNWLLDIRQKLNVIFQNVLKVEAIFCLRQVSGHLELCAWYRCFNRWGTGTAALIM